MQNDTHLASQKGSGAGRSGSKLSGKGDNQRPPSLRVVQRVEAFEAITRAEGHWADSTGRRNTLRSYLI